MALTVGLILGFIWFLAMLVFMDFIPPPHADLDPDAVAALYTHNNLQFRIGRVVMLAVSGFWFPIAMVITAQMARLEKGFPLWAVMQCAASAVGVVFFILPPLLWRARRLLGGAES